jgi:phage tail-like protein
MDINGTKFHLLQGAADWALCSPVGDVAVAFGDTVSLRPLLFQFPTPPAPTAQDPADLRRGAGRDRYGNWYWIDDDRARVIVRSVGSNATSVFWSPDIAAAADGAPAAPPLGAFGPLPDDAPAPPPCRLAGLAVTEDHYLLVGTLDQPGLLVFDLHAGGPPRQLLWPAATPFQPFDMAARPGGGVFVLDRTNRCYWALDRQLGVLDPAPDAQPPPEAFRSMGPSPDDERAPARPFPPAIALDAASPLGATDPVAIEALPDGSVLVLDRLPQPTIRRYLLAAPLGSAALDLGAVLAPTVTGPVVLGADVAFAAGAGGAADHIYVPSAGGEQAYAFTIAWRDVPLAVAADAAAPFLPMRLYGGKGLVGACGVAYYDFDPAGTLTPAAASSSADRLSQATWLPLVEQRRPRFERTGTFDTPAFDGVEPGCVWHRLLFDGCVPANAGVAIWSRTADELDDLERAPWAPEPAPRRRTSGRELPFAPMTSAVATTAATTSAASTCTCAGSASISAAAIAPVSSGLGGDSGTFELLFQRARGRFLQLRVELRGDGRTSPRLRAMRIWYPRFSYLAQYLPATYRDDPASASFLDRFLANVEGLFTAIEDRMAAVQVLFDARTAPGEALDWLAGWFGVALDPAWTEAKRRLFLRHAMTFFRIRGTIRGLQTALRLVIDDCAGDDLFTADATDAPASIRIVEAFRLRTLPPLALGDPDPASGIRQVTAPPPWTPEQGGAALLVLYRSGLATAGVGATTAAFPVFEPTDGTAPIWHQFLRDVLSLSGTAGRSDGAAWTAFLAARYPTVDALNQAWGAGFADIADVSLPAALPDDGAPLVDWYQFQLGGGRFVATGKRWIPAQGRAALVDRWSQYAHAAGVAAGDDFPIALPADEAVASAWQPFAASVLGFVPAGGARVEQAWRDFLARRYRRVASLNLAYGTAVASFDDVTLPAALPADGAPLGDWYDFQSIALATQDLGHRFSVLLPVPAREAFALEKHQQRRDLAQRIVDLEKPAHTLYDVKFYWAMFRVGDARLALDTLLDQSSRAPELMPPAVLGQASLAESRLAATPPEREQERRILGTASLPRSASLPSTRPKPEEMTS